MSVRPERPAQRVVVTGSAGFIGSHLVRDYLADGVAVRGIVRVLRDVNEVAPDGLERLELDLRDLKGLENAFAGQDLVIHAAAVMRAHDRASRELQARINVDMTRNVIEACRRSGVPRLVYVSSTAAIGISPDPRRPADESFSFNLGQLGLSYNISKHESERLTLEANSGDLETVVANPGFVFGQHIDGYRGAYVIERVLDKSVVICTGGGLSTVHVSDVVAGLRKVGAKGKPGERYILSGENRSFRAIAETVCRVAGVRRRLVSVPDVARDALSVVSGSIAKARGLPPNLSLLRRYAYQFYSSEKAQRELGYESRAFDRIVVDYLDRRRARS